MKLWQCLQPHKKRKHYIPTTQYQNAYNDNVLMYLSHDWGEIGFQSHDPSTDFRSMGLLGLIQLVYFSEKYASQAAAILFDSNHPRRYYPFSATGINITFFVLTMLRERRLDKALLHSFQFTRSTKGAKDAETESLLPNRKDPWEGYCAIEVLHELYCSVYKDFSALWIARDPENIMAFKSIFDEIKNRYHLAYPAPDA